MTSLAKWSLSFSRSASLARLMSSWVLDHVKLWLYRAVCLSSSSVEEPLRLRAVAFSPGIRKAQTQSIFAKKDGLMTVLKSGTSGWCHYRLRVSNYDALNDYCTSGEWVSKAHSCNVVITGPCKNGVYMQIEKFYIHILKIYVHLWFKTPFLWPYGWS